MLESEKWKRSQNAKCYVYILAFVVLQVAVILAFALIVMRVKTPSVRVRSVHVQSLTYNETTPSLDMTIVAEIAVRNKNFGRFKFDNTTANVTYGGVLVGEGHITKARASARKTKRMNVTIEATFDRVSDAAKLRSELGSGNLTFTSVARVRGEVAVMLIKKKKTANMNCTMTVDLERQTVHGLDGL